MDSTPNFRYASRISERKPTWKSAKREVNYIRNIKSGQLPTKCFGKITYTKIIRFF